MESDDSLTVFTDNKIGFPTLTPSFLGQSIGPAITFFSPPSTTIPSNPGYLDAQWDTESTTHGLPTFTVCTIPNDTTDQLQPTTISSSVGNAKAKISFSRNARVRSKTKFRRMQRHANKSYDNRRRITIARQHKRKNLARLDRAVKCPRFNPQTQNSLPPQNSSRELLFWDSYRQEFTIQNTLFQSQQLVVLKQLV